MGIDCNVDDTKLGSQSIQQFPQFLIYCNKTDIQIKYFLFLWFIDLFKSNNNLYFLKSSFL